MRAQSKSRTFEVRGANVREVTRRVAWPATGRNARLKPHSEFLVRALPYILSQPPHGIMQVRAARPIRNV